MAWRTWTIKMTTSKPHPTPNIQNSALHKYTKKQHSTKPLIILASGGTGGHVFPAISIANEMTRRGYDCKFITDSRGARYLDETYRQNCDVFYSKTTPRFALYIILIYNIARFLWKFTLHRRRKQIVIGFGGYPSLPAVLAAQMLGIKTIIHEQNAVIGKANMLLSRRCTILISSFDNIQSNSRNTVFVGNPTRFEREYEQDYPVTITNDTIIILVIGGSQGASIFAQDVVDAICDAYTKQSKRLIVYHQALSVDIQNVKSKYDQYNITSTVQSFFDNIGDLYKRASLVISRSGASSVFEIIGFARPCILLPFMQSINGDQANNALYLYNLKAAQIYWEDRMTMYDLSNMILNIIINDDNMIAMHNKLKTIRTYNITNRICDVIESVGS